MGTLTARGVTTVRASRRPKWRDWRLAGDGCSALLTKEGLRRVPLGREMRVMQLSVRLSALAVSSWVGHQSPCGCCCQVYL